MIKERNIIVQILLTVVTCGLYGIYWFITLTDDAAHAAGEADFSGGKAFLFTILTCGIYGLYWYYKMGKTLYVANQKAGLTASDNSVLFLVLGLFGLGIVNYCIMQNELNDLSKSNGAVAQ